MDVEKAIFQYSDYRSWLSAAFASRIERNPQLSVSSLAGKVGMSQSLLSLILRGKRKLTFQRADAVAEYLELSPQEKTYLHLLIQLEQTQEVHSREAIMHKLKEFADESGNDKQAASVEDQAIDITLELKGAVTRAGASGEQIEHAKKAMKKFAAELEDILSKSDAAPVHVNLSLNII